MIRVESVPLPETAQSNLDHYQTQVDEKPTYKKQVEKAKSSFKSRNTKSNRTFKAVKKALDSMCSGARRCHYCEDSAADEVEHYFPKDLYPECCFLWANYLYSCGRCNGSYKSNKFKIFEAGTAAVLDITPPRKNRRFVRPPHGDPLLIDPRTTNPLDYIKLNLETLKYDEIGKEETKSFIRGHWTIECLGLNSREVLVRSRLMAFECYLAFLENYHAKKYTAANETLQRIKNAIQAMPHPTVWQEMVRQHQDYEELKALFEAVPEALEW